MIMVSTFDFPNGNLVLFPSLFLISRSGHELNNFFIEFKKTCEQRSASLICHYQERPLNETTTFQCNPHMIGQYVRIRMMEADSDASTRNDLALCEVEVQGVQIGNCLMLYFGVYVNLCLFCQRRPD